MDREGEVQHLGQGNPLPIDERRIGHPEESPDVHQERNPEDGGLVLESYRQYLQLARDARIPLQRAMELGREKFPHPLNEWQPNHRVEIRNELISQFGAGNVFQEAYRQLRVEISSGACRQVHMMVGPPGSGKSTFSQNLIAPGNVIFDSAACTRRARGAVLNMGKKYGKPVHAWVLKTVLDTCIIRNSSRNELKKVPNDAIARAWQSLHELPPLMSDGFASITFR